MSNHTPSHRDGATEASRTSAAGTRSTDVPSSTSARYTADRSADRPAAAYPDDRVEAERRTETRTPYENEAHQKFGGINWGSCFFGWLVAIAAAILLTSIAGAIVAAVGSSTNVTQSEAQRRAGDIGLAAAIVLVAVLAIGYYLGGYVAGRMSRFDGGRQGLGVWLIGLVVTILAIALGAVFGNQYNLLDRVNLPNLPISTDTLGWGAAITALALLVLTLVASLLGGKAGHRYHHRVDRAAWGK
jgi:amino acid transporter